MAKGKHRKLKAILGGIIVFLVVIVIMFAVYVSDYYHASDDAYASLEDTAAVDVREFGGGYAFVPENPVAGLVFYPGAKVEPESYAPLMMQLADNGVLCVLEKPLFNLAILSPNMADSVVTSFTQVDDWYIGGHSLGGVVAASYAASHADDFDGVVLLASYTTTDLNVGDMEAVTITGTNDGVINNKSYSSNRSNLPKGTLEVSITGGNHAYFGNYGEQSGDGQATISRAEQQKQTVEAICSLVAD